MARITITITEVDGASRPKGAPIVSHHRVSDGWVAKARAVQKAFGRGAYLRLDEWSSPTMPVCYGEICERVGLYARSVLVGRVRVQVQS